MDNTTALKDISNWVIEQLMARETLPSLHEIVDEIKQAESFFRTFRAQGLPDERIWQAYCCPQVRVALQNGVLLQQKDLDKILQTNRLTNETCRV